MRTICEEYDCEKLESQVLGAIERGWQPFGSLSVVEMQDGKGYLFNQPMVKYEAERTLSEPNNDEAKEATR